VTAGAFVPLTSSPRRFPSPWTAEETEACFIVREPGRRSAAKLLTRDWPGESPPTTHKFF
jgi:hypothetical protein